jgi:PTH1 family peptidyl-tRNA hydrolase
VDPLIVVGLGNPGSEYEETRHNVGFLVVDELCRRFRKNVRPGKGDYLLASVHTGVKEIVLVKPLTYMNNSGVAVRDVLEQYEVSQERIVVVVDDFALPLGTLRVRARGSDGGHNGLYSIIHHLNSDEFPRIRCGIRQEVMPPTSMRAGFVLSPFLPVEREKVMEMIQRAGDAVMELLNSGLARAMNRFNV